MAEKKYRRVCSYRKCAIRFMGGKMGMYCCAAHRVREWQLRQAEGEYDVLRRVLKLELDYLPAPEMKKIIETSIYVIKKWLKEKKK